MKKNLLIVFAVIVCNTQAQKDWRQMMQDPNANFYDVQKAAKAYFKEYEREKQTEINKGKTDEANDVEAGGYEQYKRWEAFMEPRVYPSGNLSLPSQTWKNYQDYLNQNNSGAKLGNNMIASSTWTAMGPFGAMTSSACGLPRKAGRENFITFHPTIPTTYWAGAPAGGLWKTTNDGTTWTTTTDNLAVIGCSDLAIDPTNPNIMYLATGDGDAGDTYCIGVLKSIDGGNTWNPTGLVWTVNQQRAMRRLIINPSNTQILIAASSAGIWRTANGGTTWTQVSTIDAYDLEFKPTDPNTVYAGGGATATTHAFYLSTNGGTSFAVVSNGIPTTACTRINIAVTAADPNYVYVLRSNTSYNFGGLYRSVASGTIFTSQSTTPDVICNACTGVAGGNGQGWYDLALGANPLNRDEIVAAGVNHWKSIDGGATWNIIGCWNSVGANPPYVHADVHEVEYNSGGIPYTCNDGGIYKYTGTAWTDLSSPMNISQQYHIGLSGTTADYWITGHQDNGSNIFNGTTYDARQCGDGMDCFIDRTNNNNAFCAGPNGAYYRSTNAGITWNTATTGLTGGTYWVSPWKQDPIAAGTVYGSRLQLWKSTNLAVSWAQAGNIPGNAAQGVIEFAIAPSNNDVIYVIHGNTGVYKTTNATAATPTWAATGALPAVQATYIAIKATDPNTAWVVFSGYTAGTKVYKTINGGTTWTNVSTTLPNLPVNCIVYEPGSNDRVYVGMDVGVYYVDNSNPNWTAYNTGLPNVPVFDMEISPINPGKLYAATYGRGTYKVDVVAVAPPVSSFTIAAASFCTGQNIQFNDLSTNAPTSWSWSVTPAAGVTINTAASKNPTISFANPGTYTVSMVATNGVGPGSLTSQTINVTATPTVVVANNSQTVCAGATVSYTASGAATYAWSGGGGAAAIATYTPAGTTVYTVTGTTSGCNATNTASVTVNTVAVSVANNSQTICIGSTVSYTASGATTYTWTGGGGTSAIATYTPASSSVYTVTGTAAGCNGISTASVTVISLTVNVANNSQTVCAGSSVTYTASGATTYSWSTGGGTGVTATYNPVGSTVYTLTGTTSGCSQSKTASVTVNALPTITATTTNSNICIGSTAVLNSAGAVTYTWMPGAQNGAAVTYTPAATTIYTCTGTNANGCIGMTQLTVSVSTCASITQMAANSGAFTVFPNPTSGKITIQLSTNKTMNVNIEVMDASGKVVMKQNQIYNSTDNSHNINISHLAAGNYFLRLISEGNTQVIKVIKD